MSKAMYIATISVIIFVSIIMTVLGIALSTMVNKEESLIYNAEKIRNDYSTIINVTNENRRIKAEFIKKLETFTNEKYSSVHEEYIQIINKYQKNVNNADELYHGIKDKCEKDYKDNSITILCNETDKLYDEIIDSYIENLTNYNEKILAYNKISDNDYQTIEILYKEYITVNAD